MYQALPRLVSDPHKNPARWELQYLSLTVPAILEQPGGPRGAVICGAAEAESVRLGAEGVTQLVREAFSLLCARISTHPEVITH